LINNHQRNAGMSPKPSQDSKNCVWDFFFTFGLIGASTVLVWQGFWDLQDLYLFPDNTLLSSALSAVAGITLSGLCHLVANSLLLQYQSREPRSLLMNYTELLYMLLVSISVISYWRGVWLLWDECVLSPNPTLQSVVTFRAGVWL
jgi:hypothetical protein